MGASLGISAYLAAAEHAGSPGCRAVAAAPMIQITPHMKILVAVEPVDFRKGIDGLAAVCRRGWVTIPKQEPFLFSVHAAAMPSSV